MQGKVKTCKEGKTRTCKDAKNRTMKRKRIGGKKKSKRTTNSHIVRIFLEVLNMVKLYHWKTKSYAQHKATDELYERLNENIDKFIEVLLGKEETRIKMMEKKIDLIDPSNLRDMKARVYEYRVFLIDFNNVFDDKRDSDLLSIRDDILADINQFLYLLSFH
jgi:DNA-binding ferritin-like protein